MTTLAPISISSGLPEPLGVTPHDGGINVAVFSCNAVHIDVCLFDDEDRETARLTLPGRDGDIHHGFIAGVGPGARYGLRACGPYYPELGHRFDPAKLLVDPYARRIDRPFTLHAALAAPRPVATDTARLVPKALVTTAGDVDSLRPSRLPVSGFIYEVSVKAYSMTDLAIPAPLRGTVAALGHPVTIERLVRLGVDTVELMPLAAWIDERHLPPLGLTNAWGYNPVTFMAPDPRLAPGGLAAIRDTVSALHAAGIAVILDIVYNHTGESDALGPTLSLRGLDNAYYYRHAAEDPGLLLNDTGTGNTLATDRPAVIALVVDSMRHWAAATGIDGFRLDLAAALGRSAHGFTADAPLFRAIEADPILGALTIVAEPWDVGPDGYQLGRFPPRWREWNDRYRDDVRRFWRGDSGSLGPLATRLAGSSDIFQGRSPAASVNFVATHDGLTLADLVAYGSKSNYANGEDNRDGADENFSWNNGVEGATGDPALLAARRGDIRALLATLFASRGTVMLTAGDEFGRTQNGNNNAYAQDNSTTWLDWTTANMALAGFTARLAAFRKRHPSLSANAFLTGDTIDESGIRDAVWLKPGGSEMTTGDWNADARVVGLARYMPASPAVAADRTVVWINGGSSPALAWLPPPHSGFAWAVAIDSAWPEEHGRKAVAGDYSLAPRSVVLFEELPLVPA